MKKTLTTLTLAILAAGVASATLEERNYTVTMDFVAVSGNSTSAGSFHIPDISITDEDAPFPMITVGSSPLGAQASGNAQNVTVTGYCQNLLFSANNVGGGATVTYTVTFTAGSDCSLSEVKLALFTFSSTGKLQTTDPKINYTFEISQGDDIVLSYTPVEAFALEQATGAANEFSGGAAAYNFDTDEITRGTGNILTIGSPAFSTALNGQSSLSLDAGSSYTLSLTMTKNAVDGFFVGLGGVQMKGLVPEPGTATLSLLALAGLASRRRRR